MISLGRSFDGGVRTSGKLRLCLVASVLQACASIGPADTEAWRTAQTPIIKQRAEARWTALIKGEYETAYGFLTSAQRSVVSLQQYRGSIGGAAQWRVAQVDGIRYDSPTVAAVSVAVTYRFMPPGSGGKEIESLRQMQEKWLYKDGGWWYTAQ